MSSMVQSKAKARSGREEALCKVPVFRPVAIRLMSILTKEEPDILEVAELLQSDPGFSAEMLTVANSAAFGAVRPVNTMFKAILILGTECTRKLVVRTALQGMVRGMREDATIQNCWIHSRASGALAAWLAPHYRVHPDRAYTLGLMHDIGRLGLLAVQGRRYGELLERVSGSNAAVIDAERILFSTDHCEAGEYLARTWGLPAEFPEAARTHHQGVSGTMGDSNDLVACACALAQSLGFSAAPQAECRPIEELLECVPGGPQAPTQFSARDLSQFVCKELQI